MGIKQVDLTPPSGGPGFTAITPPSQLQHTNLIQVTRAMTAATLVQVIPAQASIIRMARLGGAVLSNAATTATVTFTVSNSSGTLFTFTSDDVKTAPVGFLIPSIALPNLENQPLNGDLRITAVYAETGTASTLGGPWNYMLEFV